MGKQPRQRTGTRPAQDRQGVPVVLAMVVDAMGFRAFAGLLAMANKHDHFGGFVGVGHLRIYRLERVHQVKRATS
ncbi:MAG: hypothetical protein IPP21_19360 [Betaproteobacteria bacterium]|nr:hypothetical protein [Betaproteobacteria bacterium]